MQLNMEKLKKITQLSANQSADALTKLTGVTTEITVVNIHFDELNYQFKQLPSDSYVTGIYLPTRGDLTGSTWLIFPKEVAIKLASLLTKKTFSSHGFDELEVSALKEAGNIICGSFFSVLSNKLGICVTGHLPLFVFDTLSAVLNQLRLWLSNDEEETTFLIELQLSFEKVDIMGYIIMRMNLSKIALIEEALDKLQFD